MIEVIGDQSSEEYAVAVAIKDALAKLWPGVETSPEAEENVRIAANVKLAGYKVSDIDVVVAAVFQKQRFFVPRKVINDRDGNKLTGAKVQAQGFVVAVEVKGQSADGVRVAGDEVTVRYKDGWKSATDQNVKQVHALKQYFADQGIDAWVYRCLALQGLPGLPKEGGKAVPAAGAVALGFSGADFLTAITGVYGAGAWQGKYFLSSGKPDALRRAMDASIFREIVPSRLDRQRMDRIAARKPEAIRLGELLGQQRVHLRGHGGTGKTVLILQAAHEAFTRHGKRCLVLTYNLALAADIQRLLALMGIPGEDEGGGVEVRTTMSFIYSWLVGLEAATEEDNDLADYQSKCEDALDMFKKGALGDADIAPLLDENHEEFDFDVVIVDEAQDWPQAEADLLARLYGGNKIALADGRDQLVRGLPTNWKRSLPAGASAEDKHLERCLRMKRNLGVFANAVASYAGLNWEITPNDEAAGGRVLLARGSYADMPALQDQLVEAALGAQNEKIDFLHCVPPRGVTSVGDRRRSALSLAFERSGHETWDGVDPGFRHDYPRSTEMFRVVQYDSCRGLEGWVTVLDRFDEFWTYKYRQALGQAWSQPATGNRSPEEVARGTAWRWAMIALTRPIDTLVITYDDPASEVGKMLLQLAKAYPDWVERLSS